MIQSNYNPQGGIFMSDKVTWLTHEFSIHRHGEQWNSVAGIYIFAGVNSLNQWESYYIGQADNFQDRIPSHEKWDKAQSLGATHVHAKAVSQQSQRDLIERQLIQAYQPSLNQQLR
jgi:excinuclease UvrABC nuclease subunit